MPEAWDTSREKARKLRLEEWGTPEEVKAMASPVRQASNRREVTAILKELAGRLCQKSKGAKKYYGQISIEMG